MKRILLNPIFILFLISSFGLASTVYSQFTTPIQPTISIDMEPQNPGPNQTVNIILESYATDLNSAKMVWQVNGKTIQNGNGLKNFSFKTGDINVNTEVSLTITTRDGEVIENTYNIKPSDVDLLWQTEGFTPPFYKGKTLFSHQNKIKFIAIPHIIGSNGQEIPPKNLIYKWTRNGTVLGDFSGYGKDTYTLVSSIISRPLIIEVEVSSPDYGGVGYTQTTVYPVDPQIVYYAKNPLYGIEFQNTLANLVEINDSQEISLISYPLYFGIKSLADQSLLYKWKINGETISNSENASTQVFRQKEGTSGTAYISLSIENQNKILQYTSKGFNLKFGKKAEETIQNF